jgi:hypothetical protein
MYRRKIVEGLSPGQPDRRHMHQLIYAYLAKRDSKEVTDTESMTRRNSKVAPYCWLMSLACAVPAFLLWKNTALLVVASLAFCAAYLLLYQGLYKVTSRQLPRGN